MYLAPFGALEIVRKLNKNILLYRKLLPCYVITQQNAGYNAL